MSQMHQITIQIAAQMSGDFKKTVEMATKTMNSFAKSMGLDVRTATSQASAYTKQYTSQIGKLSKALGLAKEAQQGIGSGFGAPVAAQLAMPKVTVPDMPQPSMLDRGLGLISNQVSNYQDRIHKASMKVEEAFSADTISASKYAKELSILTEKLKMTESMQGNLGKISSSGGKIAGNIASMRSRATDIAAGGLMAYGTLAPPIKEAMDFESAMADVRKVVNFDTPQQFKEMGQDIVALTRSIPMSAKEIATLVAAAGQAGIEKDGLLEFATAAGKMGVAFDISAEQAGDMMAKWRTSFKMGQSDVNDLADKINYLGNTTAASAPLISDVVTRIGPLGDIGGVASGEIAALGASMVGAGVQSEIAATGIKNLILGMASGTGATKQQAAAFAALGFDAADMAKRMQTDAKGAIMDVFKAIKGMSKDQQASILSDLFGRESIGAIAPLLSNLDGLQANFDKVANKQNYAGSVAQEYAARVETTRNQLDLLKNAFSEIAINIGSVALPKIGEFAKVLTEASKIVADFAKNNPDLTGFLAGLFAVVTVAPLASSVLGYLKDGVMLVINVIKFLGNSFMFLLKVIRIVGAAMISNPILAVIAAIAVAAYLIYTNWEPIKEFMAGLWAGVQAAWAGFIQWCSGMWDGVVAAWNQFVTLCGSLWDSLVQGAVDAVNAIADWFINGWNNIITFLSDIVNSIVQWFTSMWDSPAGALLSFIGGPIAGLIAAAIWVITNWSEVSNFVATMWDAGVTAVTNFATSVMNVIGEACNWAQQKWENLKSILSHPIDAVVNFIKGGDSEAAAAGGNKIKGNAKGGIYEHGAFLTWFAEDSKEAAIPIDGSRRAEQLWVQTGQMMGLLGKSNASAVSGSMPALQSANNIGSVASIMPQISNVTQLNVAQPQTPTTGFDGLSSLISMFTENKRDREIKADIQGLYNGYDKTVEINATFAPQITINGNADTAKLDQVLSDKLEEFKRMLDQITRDKRRVALV